MERALSGVRVLDFTRVLAGPYCTRLLADFGAEVIKVQSRITAQGTESNLTGYFNTWNRNKCGITLDMSHPEARHLALRLAGISDVVIENFSPRVMTNWGLSYEALREVNGHLVMVSISAMGRTGPWKDFVAFGPTLQALSGHTYLTSYDKEAPMGIGDAYGDHIIGLYAALAVLSALSGPKETRRGCHIDLSGYEALCTLLGPALLDVWVNGGRPSPQANRSDHMPAAPYGCYPCRGSDRWCVIAVRDDEEWRALSSVLEGVEWIKEERFSTTPGRIAHRDELDALLAQWTAGQSPEEVERALQAAGVPAAVVRDARDVAEDPHLKERAFFFRQTHPVLGSTLSDRPPMLFGNGTAVSETGAPLLGEHNPYVFKGLLGLTEEELSGYIEKGVVC